MTGFVARLLRPEPQRRDLTSAAVLSLLTVGDASASGVSVTPESSLAYSAVLACVRVLAEGVAQLPLITYRRKERGRERATSHPLYPVLHTSPNPYITSFEWREVMMAHLTLWGNAFCEIERDGAGRPVALWPLVPGAMTVREQAGDRWYEYQTDTGKRTTLRRDQVLHIPGFGYDGVIGRSLIRLARESVGLGIAAQRYGATVFGNGEVPGGVLQHPGVLSEDAFKRLKQDWAEQHQGLTNANRLAILEEGMTYQKTGIPPEDAQFLETRKFQRTEIAAIFRVPPHMIGDLDRATFSNIEQQSLDFVIATLGPWLVRIEQRLNMALLTTVEKQRYYIEHLVAGRLRGDLKSRYEAFSIGRMGGWLSADDIRDMENMNPLPDGQGEVYLVPMNMVDAAAPPAPEPAPAPEPEPEPRALPQPETRDRADYEMRGVKRRRRLASVGREQITDAAQRVVNRESNDILNAARRFAKRPDGLNEFRRWLIEFTAQHEPFVRERLWATAWALMQLAADEAHNEAHESGHSGTIPPEDLRRFGDDYMASRAQGWVGMLRADVYRAIDRVEGDDWLTEIEDTIDKRRQNEADGWGRDESHRIVNAVATVVWAAVGVQLLRWLTSGGENCPYCQDMDGRTIGIAQYFLSGGAGVSPEGHPPLRPGSDVRHPPLHQGCDCDIMIG